MLEKSLIKVLKENCVKWTPAYVSLWISIKSLQTKKNVVLNFLTIFHCSITCQKRISELIVFFLLNYELPDIPLQNIYILWKYRLKFWKACWFFLTHANSGYLLSWNLEKIRKKSASFYWNSICYFCFNVSSFSNLLIKSDIKYILIIFYVKFFKILDLKDLYD